MFINRLGQNDQSLERTFHRCFLPSFCSFGWEVSEEKIKMRKVNGRRTPSDGKSSHCLWQGELKTLDWRMNMGNYYKGGWFILNIFWIKGWAGHSMTTTAASWQELLFSPMISYSPLPKIKWQYFSEEKIKMRKVNGRRTPSDGKSSHCLRQGELLIWLAFHKFRDIRINPFFFILLKINGKKHFNVIQIKKYRFIVCYVC